VFILCAVCGLITTALMTVTSVIVDRARLEVDTQTDAGQHSTGTFLTGG